MDRASGLKIFTKHKQVFTKTLLKMKEFYKTIRTTRATLVVLLMGLLLLAAQAGFAQTVTSDKLDYPPGSEAIITGTGFGTLDQNNAVVEEEVQILVEHIYWDGPDHIDETYTVTTTSGNFEFNYYVGTDEAYEEFYLTAVGLNSGKVAYCSFTDKPAVDGVGSLTVTPVFVCAAGNYNYEFNFDAGSGNQYGTNSKLRITFPSTWTINPSLGGNVTLPIGTGDNTVQSYTVDGSILTLTFKTSNGGTFSFNVNNVPIPAEAEYTIVAETDAGNANGSFLEVAYQPVMPHQQLIVA